MTNTTGLAPVVDNMDRRAALVLGAAAASVLAGGADVGIRALAAIIETCPCSSDLYKSPRSMLRTGAAIGK